VLSCVAGSSVPRSAPGQAGEQERDRQEKIYPHLRYAQPPTRTDLLSRCACDRAATSWRFDLLFPASPIPCSSLPPAAFPPQRGVGPGLSIRLALYLPCLVGSRLRALATPDNPNTQNQDGPNTQKRFLHELLARGPRPVASAAARRRQWPPAHLSATARATPDHRSRLVRGSEIRRRCHPAAPWWSTSFRRRRGSLPRQAVEAYLRDSASRVGSGPPAQKGTCPLAGSRRRPPAGLRPAEGAGVEAVAASRCTGPVVPAPRSRRAVRSVHGTPHAGAQSEQCIAGDEMDLSTRTTAVVDGDDAAAVHAQGTSCSFLARGDARRCIDASASAFTQEFHSRHGVPPYAFRDLAKRRLGFLKIMVTRS